MLVIKSEARDRRLQCRTNRLTSFQGFPDVVSRIRFCESPVVVGSQAFASTSQDKTKEQNASSKGVARRSGRAADRVCTGSRTNGAQAAFSSNTGALRPYCLPTIQHSRGQCLKRLRGHQCLQQRLYDHSPASGAADSPASGATDSPAPGAVDSPARLELQILLRLELQILLRAWSCRFSCAWSCRFSCAPGAADSPAPGAADSPAPGAADSPARLPHNPPPCTEPPCLQPKGAAHDS
ncbi:unnamed protein product, partial [Closterium sp. NIES-65]